MNMNIYSYYNKLRKRFENLFLAETDEDIIYSIEREASRTSKEAQILREKLETVDLVKLGTIDLSTGIITTCEHTALKIVVNPVRPIDGIEKTEIEKKS